MNEKFEILKQNIKELFDIEPKTLVQNHETKIFLDDITYVDRKCIKYIIDSRKDDYYNLEKIQIMLERASEVIREPLLDIPNTNPYYPNSRISIKIYREEDQALLVIYQPENVVKKIFNSYYRPANRIRKKYNIK